MIIRMTIAGVLVLSAGGLGIAAAWKGMVQDPALNAQLHDARANASTQIKGKPDVDTLRTGVRTQLGPADLGPAPIVAGSPDASFDLGLRATPSGSRLTLALADDAGTLLTVGLDPGAGEAVVSVPGSAGSTVPLVPGADGDVELRVLVDASVVEVFPAGGAVAAARLRGPRGRLQMSVAADGGGARLQRLVVHGMERALP